MFILFYASAPWLSLFIVVSLSLIPLFLLFFVVIFELSHFLLSIVVIQAS